MRGTSARIACFALVLSCSDGKKSKGSSEIFDAGPQPADCPVFGSPTASGTVTDSAIVEASGLVVSRLNPGVLWTHNDSGDTARIFAIRTDGSLVATVNVNGATAVDWEDISIGEGTLYVGDIGDNDAKRASVTVYRVKEPDLASPVTQVDAQPLSLTYDDGHAHNAETLMFDPMTGDLVVVTKEFSGASEIFVAKAPLGQQGSLVKYGVMSVGSNAMPGSPLVTGGSVSADGTFVVLRTYSGVFGWPRKAGESIPDVLQRDPCVLPFPDERQGEAIALRPDASGYFTISEGKKPTVWLVSR